MIAQLLLAGWVCIFTLLGAMFFLLLINLLTFPRLHATPTRSQNLPMLSILVPARDEEQCIEGCIRSLVAQEYEPLTVIVLDDNSSDATAAIVRSIIDALPMAQRGRLQLLQGQALPTGWVGKNFACHQLAQHAQGDYLLFTDADTVHTPGMAQAVIACMQHYGVKLLTAQPEFEMKSLGERLIVPLLNFTIMTLLPVALVRVRPEPSLATGNGQLLCFHRSAYNKIGGHEAVKGKILEDVLLARAVKRAGERMIFVDALAFVRCRMYRSLAEVWAGFSKNLFAFYNYSLPFALLALLLNLALIRFATARGTCGLALPSLYYGATLRYRGLCPCRVDARVAYRAFYVPTANITVASFALSSSPAFGCAGRLDLAQCYLLSVP